ncbi:hypothetical protein ASE07_10155 [Noviherbaspirillum sp. Root189]|nr:hypothetical protein ASE07_10155 [Noviherbaspirillum sp. Root189]
MKRVMFASMLLLLFGPPLANAAEQIDHGRRLYATCAACHGTDGRSQGAGGLRQLVGQSRDALVASMKAFRSGQREATIMHQIARGYSDEQIDLIAGFLAAQKREAR